MIIELQRAHTPEEYGHEEACAICAEPFRVESIRAEISAADTILGLTCPACVGMLGRRNPERFPTLEEYEAAKLRYPGPIWGSLIEADLAGEHGSRHRELLEANRIGRACPRTSGAG